MIYLTLFSLSLLSATLLPGGSEALLIYDLSLGYNPYLLILFATVGNTLGSVINYFLGYKGIDFLVKKEYAKREKLEKASKIFKKYGSFSLLLSWVPIIGDPITFIAGVMKYDIKKFLVIVFIAKGVRYTIITILYVYNFT